VARRATNKADRVKAFILAQLVAADVGTVKVVKGVKEVQLGELYSKQLAL